MKSQLKLLMELRWYRRFNEKGWFEKAVLQYRYRVNPKNEQFTTWGDVPEIKDEATTASFD